MSFWFYLFLFTPKELNSRLHCLPAHWTAQERARLLYMFSHSINPIRKNGKSDATYGFQVLGQALSRGLQRMIRADSPYASFMVALVSLIALVFIVVVPMTLVSQGLLGLLFIIAASLINPQAAAFTRCQRLLSLFIMFLAALSTLRYGWWRISSTVVLEPWFLGMLSLVVLLAEAYYWTMLILGNFLAHWRLPRRTQPLPESRQDWPHVDVFIPSYNEPLDVVRPTVLAALDMDWPKDRLHVWLLDDGKRDQFEAFAKESGCKYIRRAQNQHAKAGNINHALKLTQSEYIAIFDCDHIPAHNFLTRTMGWLVVDEQCALVQTPHYFYSPDPIERNLDLPLTYPNEGRLFYGQLQPGNDLWNATMFCGSCAVLRRSALEEVGGIAVETVTEDAHTSMRLSQKGYSTAYLNEPLAAGLATETLQGHVGQRLRWGRGMVQILRLSCPALVPGLRWHQRVTYINACLYFLHASPRLILLTLPFVYFLFGKLLHVSIAEWIVYLIPHLVVSRVSEYKIQGKERGLFWGDMYETLLCVQMLRPTITALFKPLHGKFNVTDKGQTLENGYFDWRNGRYFLALAILNFIPLADFRLVHDDPSNRDAIASFINSLWAVYNLALCGAALHVCFERRQVRKAVRVRVLGELSIVLLSGNKRLKAECVNFSSRGLSLRLELPLAAMNSGDQIKLAISHGDTWHVFRAQIRRICGCEIGVDLVDSSHAKATKYLRCTFARPGFWAEQLRLASRVGRSDFLSLVSISARGYLLLLNLIIPKSFRFNGVKVKL